MNFDKKSKVYLKECLAENRRDGGLDLCKCEGVFEKAVAEREGGREGGFDFSETEGNYYKSVIDHEILAIRG